MAYTPQNWKNKGVDGAIAINAEHLNNLENGVDEAHDAIDNVTTGHHHDGVDSRRVSHTDLLAKGTNTHSTIDAKIVESDAHIAAANPHSGSASDSDISTHTSDVSNPHSVTAAQVGGASIVTEINSSVGILDDDNIATTIARDSEVSAYFNVATGHDHDGTDSKKIPDGSLASGTTVASAGAGDSGKLVKLDAAGHVDATTINDGDISHLNIGDIGTNSHGTIDTHLGASNPHSGSAASGANSDITQLSGLTTNLSITQGGTGQSTASAAFDALKQLATETYAGVTERATTAQDVTGTATDVATTPAGLTERLKSPGEIGGTTPATATFTTLQGQMQSVVTKTIDYNVQIVDFGQTIRVNSAIDKTMSLPPVGASEDGGRVTFIKLGAGRVTIDAAVDDKFFGGSVGGSVYADVEIGASITIEYVDAITMWTIVSANGTWTIT